MKLLDYFKMAIKNFGKKKLRTGINIFAISIGVMLIITLVSLGSGIQGYFQNKVNELYNLKQVKILPVEYQSQDSIESKLNDVNSNGDVDYTTIFKEKKINESLLEELRTNEKIEDIIIKYEDNVSEIDIDGKKVKDVNLAFYNGKQYLSSEENSLIEMNSKARIQIPINYIAYGENIKSDSSKAVLLNEDVAEITFGYENPEDIIGKEITITTNVAEYDLSKNIVVKAKVIGLIDKRFFQPSVVVSKDIMENVKNFYLNQKTPLLERGADSVEVAVKDVENVSSIIKLVEENYGYSTESVQTVAKTINKALILLKMALSIIGIIVICIASLDVINTMIMSIFERTRSIGLMKAVGATNKDVLKLFLVEGGTIGFIGGIIGIILSVINLSLIKGFVITISSAITNVDTNISEIFKIDVGVTILTLIFAVLLTVLASLYPSLKASKLDPIDALKHD